MQHSPKEDITIDNIDISFMQLRELKIVLTVATTATDCGLSRDSLSGAVHVQTIILINLLN